MCRHSDLRLFIVSADRSSVSCSVIVRLSSQNLQCMLTESFWYNHGCCHTPCDRQCCLFNMAPEGINIVGAIIYQWNTSYCLHNFLQWTASLFRGFLSRYSLSSDICIGKSYVLGKLKYPVLYAQECYFVFDHLLAGSGSDLSCSLTVCSVSHSEFILYSFIITSVSLSAPGPQCETKPFLLLLHPF